MTPKKASIKIKELLDALPRRKTNKEKLGDVAFIKILLEIIEEPIKKRKDNEAALAKKKQIIKKALKQFINDLDKIFSEHEELGDTDVRERLTIAVHKSFILQQSDYMVPSTFGMFSDEGNKKVLTAVQRFLAHPEVTAASKLLKSWDDRLGAFQDNGGCYEFLYK